MWQDEEKSSWSIIIMWNQSIKLLIKSWLYEVPDLHTNFEHVTFESNGKEVVYEKLVSSSTWYYRPVSIS